MTNDDFITRNPPLAPSPLTTPSKPPTSAFSPTFEPSPDNPLASRTHGALTQRPSQASLTRDRDRDRGTPPIRTPSGQYTPLSHPSPPPSPAPFSQMTANPHAQRGPRPVASQSSLGRKNSTLRKLAPAPPPAVSPVEDIRMGQRGGPGDRYFTNPRPAPTTMAMTMAGNGSGSYVGSPVYDGRHQVPGRGRTDPQGGVTNDDGQERMGSNSRDRKKDEHGKGCGCVIM